MLTKARFLFKLRNTSWFLMPLRSTISAGSNRACSMALATYLAFPCWKSLMEALLGKGAPSNTIVGAHAGTSNYWSALFSMTVPSLEDLVWVTLACLPPLWASASLDGDFLLSSTTSFPFWSHFLFLLVGSGWRVCVEGRAGGLDWFAFSKALPLPWASINSGRLVLDLHCSTIALGIWGSSMAHLGGGKVTEVLSGSFWKLVVVENFKFFFGFRNINYFFLLSDSWLWWRGYFLGGA